MASLRWAMSSSSEFAFLKACILAWAWKASCSSGGNSLNKLLCRLTTSRTTFWGSRAPTGKDAFADCISSARKRLLPLTFRGSFLRRLSKRVAFLASLPASGGVRKRWRHWWRVALAVNISIEYSGWKRCRIAALACDCSTGTLDQETSRNKAIPRMSCSLGKPFCTNSLILWVQASAISSVEVARASRF